MAVKLRLMRMGKKKQPTYRVVAADSRSPRNGRFIEILGTYDPRQEPSVVKIDTAKANDWITKGAKPTDVVARLIKVAESSSRRSPPRLPPPKPPRHDRRRPGLRRRRRQPDRRRCPPPTSPTDDPDGDPAPTAISVLDLLVTSLVDDPDAVRIDPIEQRGRIRLEVRVGPDDMGRVIGKRGRVANAIRTIVRAAAVRDGVDVDVEFED